MPATSTEQLFQDSFEDRARRLPLLAPRMPRRHRVCALSLTLLTFVAAMTTRVSASTLTVNTLDGTSAVDGLCSLPEAVVAANTDAMVDGCLAGTGWDRIVFGVSGTIPLTSTLALTAPLSVVGPGAMGVTIDGQGATQLFAVPTDGTLLISGVTLTGGYSSTGGGGAIVSGMRSDVTLIECVVAGNVSANGGGAVLFENDFSAPIVPATLRVERTLFSDNHSQGSASGGAVRLGTSVVATFLDTTFEDNTATTVTTTSAAYGGAVLVFSASAIFDRCTFSGNSAQNNGGAIAVLSSASLVITSSTLSGNSAGVQGGAFDFSNTSSLTMGNTIVAGNTAPAAPNMDSATSTTSLGWNLVGDNTGCTGPFPFGSPNANNDFVGQGANPIDADLTALMDNGGWTPTFFPNSGSPAVDSGTCPGESADQRGYVGTDGRVVAVACDIGAVELGATDPDPMFLDNFESATYHRWSGNP